MTTPPDPLIPHQPDPADALAWLKGKTPEELGAIEVQEPCAWCRGAPRKDTCAACGGTGKAGLVTLFPGALSYRNARGQEVREELLWKIPGELELTRATKAAVEFVALEHPKQKVENIAAAQALVGEQRFLALENAALVCAAARSTKAPHGPLYLLPIFLQTFPRTTQVNAFFELDTLSKLWDVRVGHLTEEQFLAFVAELARVRNITPFAVLALDLQAPFIVRLACELRAFQTCNSCSGCTQHSTPGSSAPPT